MNLKRRLDKIEQQAPVKTDESIHLVYVDNGESNEEAIQRYKLGNNCEISEGDSCVFIKFVDPERRCGEDA